MIRAVEAVRVMTAMNCINRIAGRIAICASFGIIAGNEYAPAQGYLPDANTVLLLHFNETSGDTAYDASGNNYHGVASGTTIVDGQFGKARSFNGTSDVINTSYNGNFGTGPFTVEFWINLNSLSAPHQNIIGNRTPGNWWIGVFDDGKINVDGGSGQITSGAGESRREYGTILP